MKKYAENLTETMYGIEGTLHLGMFDGDKADIDIRARNCSEEYVQRCAEMLVELSGEQKEKLLKATAAYALEYVEEYGWEDPDDEWDFTENSPIEDILKYVFPVAITITPPKECVEEDAPPAIDMELSCVWELEHGLEWMIRDGEVLYVGSYDGVSPWRDLSNKAGNYIDRV